MAQIMSYTHMEGSIIIIEYDLNQGNLWVLYAIAKHHPETLLDEMELVNDEEIGKERSVYERLEIHSM